MQVGLTNSKLDGFDFVLDGITLPRTTFTDFDRGIGALTHHGPVRVGRQHDEPEVPRLRATSKSATRCRWLQGVAQPHGSAATWNTRCTT